MDTMQLAETKTRTVKLVHSQEAAQPAPAPARNAVDPNHLIDLIIDALNYAELARDAQGYVKARRLLNNDLRQAIDEYIHWEIERAQGLNSHLPS